MGDSFYEILGIEKKATQEEIKSAFVSLARVFHPDKNPDPVAKKEFIKIQAAFETLNNPERRKVYDLSYSAKDNSSQAIKVTNKISQAEIATINERQMVYWLLEISSNLIANHRKAIPVSICLIIDRSTSMKGDRIEMVKSSAKKLIKQLRTIDTVSIVSFNDQAEIVLAPVHAPDQRSIEGYLDRIKTAGGTEIYKGVKAGIDLLWQGRSENTLKYVFLFTDGHTYGDEQKTVVVVKEAAKQGIIVNTFGFGHLWNDTFLDQLSNLTGGTSSFVSHPEDLYNYLDQFVKSINDIAAKKVTLEFSYDPKVHLKGFYRITPDLSEIGVDQHTIILGDIFQSSTTTLLFNFEIEPLDIKDNNIILSRGEIQFVNCSTEKKDEIKIYTALKIVEEMDRVQPPPEIVRALYNINLYEMQEKSRQEIKVGMVSDGVKKLEKLAQEINLNGNSEFADTILAEVSQIKKESTFSIEGEKRIKYGTKSLTLNTEVRNRKI